jgi:hypothetical protein
MPDRALAIDSFGLSRMAEGDEFRVNPALIALSSACETYSFPRDNASLYLGKS